MMLHDMATVLRNGGMAVMETAAWQTRGHGNMHDVRAIIIHHTAGPPTGEVPSLNTVINGRPGLDGPLCNLLIGRSGAAYPIAAGLAWHAGVVDSDYHSNGYAIGIECEGTGIDSWPAQQYAAIVQTAALLAQHYTVPVGQVLGHKEVARPVGRKVDPNFDMTQFRAAVGEWDMALSQADKDWMMRTFARQVDIGYARDQIMLSLGFDPTRNGPKLDASHQPATKTDVTSILAAIEKGPTSA